MNKMSQVPLLYYVGLSIAALCCLPFGASFVNRPSLSWSSVRPTTAPSPPPQVVEVSRSLLSRQTRPLYSTPLIIIFENDDDDEDAEDGDLRYLQEYEEEEEDDDDDEVEDPYTKVASSEFIDQKGGNGTTTTTKPNGSRGGSLVTASGQVATGMDWGGALGRLRERVNDVESGKSQDPSHVLFRLMSSQSPNQAIGSFIQSANPQVVQAMSGAVSSLLGGLASPQSGIEMIVKASGDKMGALCFQLQMTGYLFRNAEYILALRDLLKLSGSASWHDYKDAFHKLDRDGSGYIEAHEVRDLLNDVYKGKVPDFEIDAFLRFFDQNQDGKVSWDEFERGLGAAMAQRTNAQRLQNLNRPRLAPVNDNDDDDEEEEDDVPELRPDISGQIEIVLEDGRKVKVEAKEYIESLKQEARALKEALLREKNGSGLVAPAPSNGRNNNNNSMREFLNGGSAAQDDSTFGSITSYIASRQGDVKSLTEGISPEIVETMKLLVDYVLDGGESQKGKTAATAAGKNKTNKAEMSMEIPSSALQQLALWQLILGYRLREAEAKGDYLKLLE